MSSTSSSSNSSFNRGVSQEVVCVHEIAATMNTSHTEKNPEMRFYCCSRTKAENCGFWRWKDPELSSYYKMCMNKLILQRDKVSEELKLCKFMGEMQARKYEDLMTLYEVKCADVEEMKIVMKEQELEISNLKWKLRITKLLLVLIFGVLAMNHFL
ncbi:uncharacterized protein LOC130986799 [Salvia miltiorrhiza]|uniref:uncharacterized protein LOC130986799 n=1 Tax=Salvia miltiorrhiza TaxID=226208 RepID=UPI0025AC2723|nr:uncharacterized protein LOC130986799 [Salvia miltiorrhiza]